MIADSDKSKTRRRRRRPLQEQKFSNYLSFGQPATVCLGVFLFIYALVLLCASPLLQQEAPKDTHITHGQVLKPVVSKLGERIKNFPQTVPHVPEALKQQVASFRKEKGKQDSHLIDKAQEMAQQLRKKRDKEAESLEQKVSVAAANASVDVGKRTGFLVLGMHRSGTSMLSGLLVNGMGYNVGGPLIGASFDNTKGFFELLPAVLQNDEFMNLQRVWWSANVMKYDPDKALEDKETGKAKFLQGKKALAFLNDADNAPWLQKDPRMCITLKTWLPLFNTQPAIVFTYRHPLEVANSLVRREASFSPMAGLRLWIVYNMRGIQNSAGLCRVTSSNDAVLADPLNEVKRISEELTISCGVQPPPDELTDDAVKKFVDTSLQHETKKKIGEDQPIVAKHGNCEVHDLITDTKVGSDEYKMEHKLYLIAMKMYCDMESGAAFKDQYVWPSLDP